MTAPTQVACTLAGNRETAVGIMSRVLKFSPGPTLLIGSREATKTSLLDAVCINGAAAHALDYDDMAGGGYPSAPVVPVLLALGESLQSTGRELVDAYLTGFEVRSRLSHVLLPHHYNAGWHPTATIGTFGAAIAASRLLKLDTQTDGHGDSGLRKSGERDKGKLRFHDQVPPSRSLRPQWALRRLTGPGPVRSH